MNYVFKLNYLIGDPENPLPPIKSLVQYALDDSMEIEEIKNPAESLVSSSSVEKEVNPVNPPKDTFDHSYSTVNKEKAAKKDLQIESDENKKL